MDLFFHPLKTQSVLTLKFHFQDNGEKIGMECVYWALLLQTLGQDAAQSQNPENKACKYRTNNNP